MEIFPSRHKAYCTNLITYIFVIYHGSARQSATQTHVFPGVCLWIVQLFMLFISVASAAADHYRKFGEICFSALQLCEGLNPILIWLVVKVCCITTFCFTAWPFYHAEKGGIHHANGKLCHMLNTKSPCYHAHEKLQEYQMAIHRMCAGNVPVCPDRPERLLQKSRSLQVT